MAKSVPNAVLDAALDYIGGSNQIVLCSGQPSTYADATTDNPTGNALGESAVTSGDFTNADGDVSGRKVTVSQVTGIDVDVTGTWDHVALVNTGDSTLRLVTTVTSQSVTSGGTVTINAFDFEIEDPA